MRVVIQLVSEAKLLVNHKVKAFINDGLVVFLGIGNLDTDSDVEWLVRKIANMRIFCNCEGIKDLSVKEVNGDVLVVSQFTLYAKVKKGNRPAYVDAAKPKIALPLYKEFVAKMEKYLGKRIETGEFGQYMQVDMINDGPLTIILDSKVDK